MPGIIDYPAWTGVKLISLNPDRGTEDNSRRSLQISDNFTAMRFSTLEKGDIGPRVRRCLYQVTRQGHRQTRDAREFCNHGLGISIGRVDTPADRSAATILFVKQVLQSIDDIGILENGDRKSHELLTQGLRIPEYPPTHSDNMRPPIPGYPPTCDALP